MLKLVVTTLALGTLLNVIAISQVEAKHKHRKVVDANGNSGLVVSHKTGAKARVASAHAAKFQAYVDDLEENHGAKIYDMGGVRRGKCSSGHMHPCGKAIDLCQLRRGVVSPRCYLPDRDIIAVVAANHGLFEGGLWCDQDYGHAQVGESAPACKTGENILVAKSKERKVRYAARSRTRTASLHKRSNGRHSHQASYSEGYRLHAGVQDYGWGASQVRSYGSNKVRGSRHVGGQSYYAYYRP